MSLKTFITDISSGLKARVDNDNNLEENALVVASRPLKTLTNKLLFFSNPVYGIDMNQDIGTAGTPINIHNGIDNVYWTASAIVGSIRWDFNSTDQAHSGTHSIDVSQTINSDEAQFAKGSGQDTTGYTTITGWIYITGWVTTGVKEVHIYGWDIGVGQVGNIVNIGNYIETTVFNSWQKFVIPLIDMNLTNKTIDSIRVKTISTGAGAPPAYYLDDLQIQENDLSIEYIVEPDLNTWLYVDQMNTIMADALVTTLADASMYNLSYNKFLGVSELSAGLLYQIRSNNKIVLSISFSYLLEFLQLPNTNILNAGCDGVNTWLILSQIFTSPILLKSEKEDKMIINIRDDMSELLKFRISVSCREEQRSGS